MAGALARSIGPPQTVILIGSLLIGTALWFASRLPQLRRAIQLSGRGVELLPATLLTVVKEAGTGCPRSKGVPATVREIHPMDGTRRFRSCKTPRTALDRTDGLQESDG